MTRDVRDRFQLEVFKSFLRLPILLRMSYSDWLSRKTPAL